MCFLRFTNDRTAFDVNERETSILCSANRLVRAIVQVVIQNSVIFAVLRDTPYLLNLNISQTIKTKKANEAITAPNRDKSGR